MRKIMTMPTYKWGQERKGELDKQPKDTKYEMPFSSEASNGQHYGMPISKHAFIGMIGSFYTKRNAGDADFDIACVTFSKASLMRILSQEKCEKVRFYFAYPEPNELTLTMEGVDINDKSLGLDAIQKEGEPEQYFYEEKGNGGNGEIILISSLYDKLNLGSAFTNSEKSEDEKAIEAGNLLLKAINGIS